ncbi:MAG: aspartyl protease family protein [Blastocatellia bacterium]
MNRYSLIVQGNLFFTKAAIKHQGRVRVVKLLIDCGASQTILSWGALASLEIDPAISPIRRRIVTANGLVQAPEVTVEELHSLGQRVNQLPVLALTIPFGSQIAGVLGMNFLRRFDTDLNFKQATIRI